MLSSLVYGLSRVEISKEICEGCELGKHAREKFLYGEAWRAKYPLQLVHSNICGLTQTQSMGKASYFITLIDDYFRYCWVLFIKMKNEAFS